ncbi:hypothetical protein [Sphingomonas humi]|uniref:Restriction endonuclease n=1 Tax=Sphingomonas humi TaxID=335630 RepID=A0ABP7RH31_9SPHN
MRSVGFFYAFPQLMTQSWLPIIERLARRLYGSPIVRNSARGELVEEIVATALEPEWQLTGDWGECDLKHPSGLRIQVKQSAARQSWHSPGAQPSRGHFSTAYKTGRYESDGSWTSGRSRNADIFIFAWHPLCDEDTDHRDPLQWRFFVIGERALPEQASLSLATLRRHAEEIGYGELRSVVEMMTKAIA